MDLLTHLRASWKWWYPHLGSYSFVTSQTTGWSSSLIWFAGGLLQLKLQRLGVNVWKRQLYGAATVSISLAIYKVFDICYVYFVKPVPLKREPIVDDPPLQNQQGDKTFRYLPLAPNVFTRLLLIHPALSADADLAGQLVDFPFDTPVYFHALSYTWGHNALTHHILLDGKRLPISANCAAALSELRPRFKGILIWCDAVCIDQSNQMEKSQQLERMKTIYGNAADTIIWLNDESGSDEIALRYLRLFAAGKFLPKRIETWWEKRVRNKLSERGHDWMFAKLIDHTWMKRIWTVQELALGKKQHTWLLCGSQQILFDHIGWPLSRLTTYDALADRATLDGAAINTKILIRILARMNLRYTEVIESPTPMSKLLLQLQTHSCTDARDRVYGLLAFFESANVVLPQPSYAKSAPTVFWEAMTTICKQEKSLDLLALHSGYREPDMDLVPSWVPDFRTPATPRRTFTGFQKATSDSRAHFQIMADGRCLMTAVERVDTVKKVSHRTLWQPKGDPLAIRDGLDVNLEQGARQSIEALIEWYYISEEQPESPYKNRMDAYRELLVQAASLNRTSDEAFGNWMTLLLSLHREAQIEHEEEQGTSIAQILDALHEHARLVPELYQKYFDPSAPLHEMTKDMYWSMMSYTKTNTNFNQLYHYIWSLARDCKFFVTDSGYIGTGTIDVERGDSVVLIAGFKSPMIVRLVDGFAEIVGTAYVQGLMDGTFWDNSQVKNVAEKPIMMLR